MLLRYICIVFRCLTSDDYLNEARKANEKKKPKSQKKNPKQKPRKCKNEVDDEDVNSSRLEEEAFDDPDFPPIDDQESENEVSAPRNEVAVPENEVSHPKKKRSNYVMVKYEMMKKDRMWIGNLFNFFQIGIYSNIF